MLFELGFQLSNADLERCDLLVEQEVFGLDVSEQGVHKRAHRRRRGCPIERRDVGRWLDLVHRHSFEDQRPGVKSDAV